MAFSAVDPYSLTHRVQRELDKHHQRYLEDQIQILPTDRKIEEVYVSAPTNAYLGLLQKGGFVQEAFDTVQMLPTTGPLAPDARAFTAIFAGLAWRDPGRQLNFDALKAAEALWSDLLARSEEVFAKRQHVDAHVANAYLYLLARQRNTSDRLKALWATSSINSLPLKGNLAAQAMKHRDALLPKGQLQIRPQDDIPGLTASLEVLKDLKEAETACQWVQLIAVDPTRRESLRAKDFALALMSAKESQQSQLLIQGQRLFLMLVLSRLKLS